MSSNNIELKVLCPGCFEASTGGLLCSACDMPCVYDDPLSIGTRLKEECYCLGRVLGRGGFGITYIAWDLKENRRVAIKEYLPQDFGSRLQNKKAVHPKSGSSVEPFEDGKKKFIEEAKKLWSLRLPDGSLHSCIVEVYECFSEHATGTAYLVMEYLGDCTFEQHLRSQPNNRVSYEMALNILGPVMDGLHFIHKNDLFHRDVSPENICITPAGTVKLIDFGAAKFAMKAAEPTRTRSIPIREGYSPLEQYGTTGYGAWTDVYALGATFYRAITGAPPPPSPDRQLVINEHGPDLLVLSSSCGVSLPRKAEAAINKALEVKSSNRYNTIREFQSDLPGFGVPAQDEAASNKALKVKPSNRYNTIRKFQSDLQQVRFPRQPLWVWSLIVCLVVGFLLCCGKAWNNLSSDVESAFLFFVLGLILMFWLYRLILWRKAPSS
jgi:serine/threonine protein kinase